MTINKYISQKQSHLLYFILLIICSLLLIIGGCKKKEQEPKETKPKVTIENLQTAYAKSISHSRLYSAFAKQAEKENLKNVAKLFQAVAHSEQIHAERHAELLRSQGVEPITPTEESITQGKTIQNLKKSISTEDIEFQSMYPNLIRTADLEKYQEAVDQFRKIQDVDAQHYDLFKDAHDKGGKISKVSYFVCSQCGYILTSEKTEECPICGTKKEKFKKI